LGPMLYLILARQSRWASFSLWIYSFFIFDRQKWHVINIYRRKSR
jgi:hypothetical protein